MRFAPIAHRGDRAPFRLRGRVVRGAPLVIVAAVLLSLSSCSSNGTAGSVAPSPSTIVSRTTTIPDTLAPASSAVATTSIAPPPVTGADGIAPLTGLPSSGPLDRTRVLVAKIDNLPSAWPQAGVNQADIVFEENVEGWTRFAAVFHSTLPEVVGPIRSGRTQDIDLLTSLGSPALIWSGGNPGVTAAIKQSALVSVAAVDVMDEAGFSRDTSRPAPSNLFARVDAVVAYAGPPDDEVAPQFAYRAAGSELRSAPVDGVKLGMDGGMHAQWLWNPAASRYERSTEAGPQVDTDGSVLSTDNVVVILTTYRQSAVDARSPEAVTVGGGEVVVLSGGRAATGRWRRPTAQSGWELTDNDGSVIGLAPGRTWVVLATPWQFAFIESGVDPASVPWPT